MPEKWFVPWDCESPPRAVAFAMLALPEEERTDVEGAQLLPGDTVYVAAVQFVKGLPWARVGADAWAQMHDGSAALLRPEEKRSQLYESVWEAAQAQLPPQELPTGGGGRMAIPLSSSASVRSAYSAAPVAGGFGESSAMTQQVQAGASVVNLAGMDVESMRLWTPEQIEAFARGLRQQ